MKALVIVDMQNDFMPGGPLGVKGADVIVKTINAMMSHFDLIVASQDWHPIGHVSFASTHLGKKVGDHILLGDQDQVLWPVHCVQGTVGAELVSTLHQDRIVRFFYKGVDKTLDSYSAFFDNARKKSTGLDTYLKSSGVTDVYLVGVATDYCVLYSTLDAIDLGFCVHVVIDACRPINLSPQDEERALGLIVAKGGRVITSLELS